VTLFGYWRSSASWRVRIALSYKGIAWHTAPVHLVRDGGEQHASSYHVINPMEQVPALLVDDETPPLTQSLAILEYLEETHPMPPLLPSTPVARARARALAECVNSGIQPLQNLFVLKRIKAEYHGDEQAWARLFIERGLAAMEEASRLTAGEYLVGDAVTVADVCLVPQLYNARRFGVALDAYPTLVRVEANCERLPSFALAHPDRQPDAPTAIG
jgi:maleylpyruvate isomerase